MLVNHSSKAIYNDYTEIVLWPPFKIFYPGNFCFVTYGTSKPWSIQENEEPTGIQKLNIALFISKNLKYCANFKVTTSLTLTSNYHSETVWKFSNPKNHPACLVYIHSLMHNMLLKMVNQAIILVMFHNCLTLI